jgi:hypothetical protein
VTLDAGCRALRWLPNTLATVAATKIDDHGPLANAAVHGARFLAGCAHVASPKGAQQRGQHRQRREGESAQPEEAENCTPPDFCGLLHRCCPVFAAIFCRHLTTILIKSAKAAYFTHEASTRIGHEGISPKAHFAGQ